MTTNRLGSEDLRTRRTRRAIRDAFLFLIEKKGFDAITVQNIADQAVINRVTFYKHYQDKYDLMERIMQELFEEAAAPLQSLLQNPPDLVQAKERVTQALRMWLEQAAQQEHFYRLLLGPKRVPAFTMRLRDYLETAVKQVIELVPREARPTSVPSALLVRFIADGILGVLELLFEKNQSNPPRDWPIEDTVAYLYELLQRIAI